MSQKHGESCWCFEYYILSLVKKNQSITLKTQLCQMVQSSCKSCACLRTNIEGFSATKMLFSTQAKAFHHYTPEHVCAFNQFLWLCGKCKLLIRNLNQSTMSRNSTQPQALVSCQKQTFKHTPSALLWSYIISSASLILSLYSIVLEVCQPGFLTAWVLTFHCWGLLANTH